MDNLVLKHNIAIDRQQPKKGFTEGSKYMGDQPDPHIEIGVETRGSERVFFVRDNGMGIDTRYSEKIFELFDKLDPGSDGSGLGLALVKRIIEVHGGPDLGRIGRGWHRQHLLFYTRHMIGYVRFTFSYSCLFD